MNTFTAAVQNQSARTENGMLARKDTGSANVTLFFKIGASRGMNVIPEFVSAFVEDSDKALRIAQWCRDVRSGAGERALFKQILNYLEDTSPNDAIKLVLKIPELGRWDDGYCLKSNKIKDVWYKMVSDTLKSGQIAKSMLDNLSNLSEAECKKLLDDF